MAAHTVRPGSSSSFALPQGSRLHRRGFRSAAARLRRAVAWRARLGPDDSETESEKNPVFQSGPTNGEACDRVRQNPDFRSGRIPAEPEMECPEIPFSGQASATKASHSGAHGPLCGDPLLRGEGSLRGAGGTLLNVPTVVKSCSSGVVFEEVVSEPPKGVGSSGNPSLFGRSGQSGPPTESISDTFTLFSLNPQGIETEAKLAQFDALAQQYQQPTIVGVTETWLTRKTGHWTLSGYTRVSRLDRRVGRPDRGGIALFVKDSFAENVVHVGDSPIDERSWHIVHCDRGPVLLCMVPSALPERDGFHTTLRARTTDTFPRHCSCHRFFFVFFCCLCTNRD